MKADRERCSKTIFPSCFRSMIAQKCSKSVWKDGFCKVHHPSSVEKRSKEKDARWEEKQRRSPHAIIERMSIRIKALEAEIELLKKQ